MKTITNEVMGSSPLVFIEQARNPLGHVVVPHEPDRFLASDADDDFVFHLSGGGSGVMQGQKVLHLPVNKKRWYHRMIPMISVLGFWRVPRVFPFRN